MSFFIDTLRHHPEVAIFLTLAIGFVLGTVPVIKAVGTVTCTLVAGLIVGQLSIHVPDAVGSTFFTIFLFAVGFSTGPQFFPALKKDGLPQVAFSIIVCASGLATAYVAAKILGYSPGLAAGLLAGGYTNSGTLGVATGNVHLLGLDAANATSMAALMAIGYAVTYPFGTAGAAWFLASFVPKIFRIDLPAACKELEAKLGGTGSASLEMANPPVLARAFRLVNAELIGHTPRELNRTLGGAFFVARHREDGRILEVDADVKVQEGGILAVAGSPHALVLAAEKIGPEVNDPELLNYPAEKVDIVVTNKKAVGRTIGDIEQDELDRFGRPVFVLGVTRNGQAISPTPDLRLQRWDVLTVRGARSHVEPLIKTLGSADRPTSKSDVAFMGFGIVIGSLIGAITIHVAGIPLGLSTFVGSLLAGLVFGYIHGRYRTFGNIPAPALWAFNNIGLNGFIAVVGLNAGPGLASGLASYGIGLFVAGMFVSMVPLVVGVLVGKYVFRFHPGLMLGACAGARTTTAAIGALQEAAKSAIPVIGYTVPYAVGRIILAVFGIVILLVTK